MKQIFSLGSFPEVGEKQTTEKERLNDGNNNGQLCIKNATSCGTRKATWAKNLKSNPGANYHDIGLHFVFLWPRRLCVRHPRWRWQCVAGHYQLSVCFLSFSVFCFWPTSGKLTRLEICFPQYFVITRRYMPIKKFGNFYFFKKKRWFFGRLSAFYGQRLVTAAWATRSPWSIID